MKATALKRSAVALIALIAGCTASASSTSGVPTSLARASLTPPRDVIPVRTCEQAIGILDPTPEHGVGTIVLGRVWFPSAPPDVLRPSQPRTSEGNLFYKQGISVRAGTLITMTVPEASSRQYALDFASVPVQSTSPLGEGERSIQIQPCPHDSQGPWTAFSGGFLAPEPACVTVVVRADARSERLRIGLGTRC
jgi:hypothetical protein